jgi:molecular chaperone HscA
VGAAKAGEDHRALKSAVEALNRASEDFAGRRMDRSVSRALAGRRLDEVPTK